MARMLSNIVNRVEGLPQPSSNHEALYPLFEAVSNAVYAIQDLDAEKPGKISIIIRNFQEPKNLEIEVRDNGIGFDDKHFEAFSTTDSSCRLKGGHGKGVGRLLWLAAFESIVVESVFRQDEQLMKRRFSLQREPENEIEGGEASHKIEDADLPQRTSVQFKGLREGAYRKHFPRRNPKRIFKHLGSHFLADILLERFPEIHVSVDEKTAKFPEYLTNMRIEQREDVGFQVELDEEDKKADEFRLSSFVLEKEASVGFPYCNVLHLMADGRKVLSRPLDNLLGFKGFGNDYVYHGCVEGAFLNQRANQQRTYFNFDEATAEKITKECMEKLRSNTLRQECEKHDERRSLKLGKFFDLNPSYNTGPRQVLFDSLPRSATTDIEFAKALAPNLIRRRTEHRKRIEEVMRMLDSDEEISKDFGEKVRKAAENVKAEEQLQLAEYVLRRTMLLDVMEKLIGRTKLTPSGEKNYQLEKTLHQFICPMRVHGGSKVEASAHNLWILDERLTFTTYFASDIPFTEILEKSTSKERPDLLVFDQIYGMSLKGKDPLKRVLLVEFKRPGRDDYPEDYDPTNQVRKYVDQLREAENVNCEGNRVRISQDCVYHCWIVADITKALKKATRHEWQRTYDGRRLSRELTGVCPIFMEIIEWADLVQDAQIRNKAFRKALGV